MELTKKQKLQVLRAAKKQFSETPDQKLNGVCIYILWNMDKKSIKNHIIWSSKIVEMYFPEILELKKLYNIYYYEVYWWPTTAQYKLNRLQMFDDLICLVKGLPVKKNLNFAMQ